MSKEASRIAAIVTPIACCSETASPGPLGRWWMNRPRADATEQAQAPDGSPSLDTAP
jgi:hypothetical protein